MAFSSSVSFLPLYIPPPPHDPAILPRHGFRNVWDWESTRAHSRGVGLVQNKELPVSRSPNLFSVTRDAGFPWLNKPPPPFPLFPGLSLSGESWANDQGLKKKCVRDGEH